MSTFENLEGLNAQIDIWIDEEDYERVCRTLPISNDGLRKDVDSCFEPLCTQGKNSQWQTILSRDTSLPIEKARPTDREKDDISLDNRWAPLFYAKLLRARIQNKGTDCYLRRLDEVEAYLENHFPTISDEDTTKLAILYLLELAAASQSFEIIGFADRARRVINERKDMLGKDAQEFIWFYDLFVSYNIGVGHFHKSHYREAILEFNRIIEQVRKEQTNKSSKLDYFKLRHGYLLLYLPAVIYRADVQLRLQLAYHALDTIYRYLKPAEEISIYMEVRKHLITTEAHQQMGRLDEAESWKHLSSAYSLLNTLDKSPNKPQELTTPEDLYDKLKERTSFTLLPFALFKGQRQNIKGQFLHFYIEDHLEWLDKSCPTTDVQNQIRASRMLSSMFGPRYFKLVQLHAGNRNGYFQQLAKFMAWLARTKEPALRTMAKKLYEHRGVQMLKEPSKGECSLCTSQRVDLRRMNPEYYSWFKDYMLKFFEDLQKSPDGNKEPEQGMELELEKFVGMFIEQESDREDLRIADLGLRYKLEKLESVRDQLQMGHDLCHPDYIGAPPHLSPAFCWLLDGNIPDEESKNRRDLVELNSEEYRLIMGQWDAGFLRRLRSKSNQGRHKRGLYLIGLQRWNSSSPAQGRSIGGGYLLYHTDKDGTVDLGIAIDPGFDFVRNLFHEGFGISDIDIVLISHSHVDHVRDFESIVQLLADLKKLGNKREKCVHVMLSLGVYDRLKHIIEDPFYRYHVEPYIIDARREIERDYFENLSPHCAVQFVKRDKEEEHKQGMMRYWAVLPGENLASQTDDSRIKVTVQPTRAYHTDPSNYSDSFGFKIEVTEPGEKTDVSADAPSPHTTTLGYTGDTKWVFPLVPDPLEGKYNRHQIWDVSEQYYGCDAVIVHLGSLVDTDENGLRKEFMNCLKCNTNQQKECRGTVCKKDHPYLAGLIRLLSSLRSESRVKMKTEGKLKQLVLVSEFGEELRGGIRVNLIERLKLAYKDALSFLPLDVGIDVQLLPREKREDDNRVASNEQKVWCIQCEQFVAIDAAKFERYGVDEALFCFCETCRKATPLNVMQDRMRQLYEVGHDLRTLNE
jgi:ribonuclease BN (tRNA processing enzyme)